MSKIREIFNFEVEKFPLNGPDNMVTPHYGLFRSDTGECVGEAFKKGYTPHTTDDVVAIYDAAEKVFGEVNIKASFKDGHYLYFGPTNAERRIIASLKNAKYPDGIFPRLRLRAGYDGKAFSLSMGYFRDLCSNLSRLRSVKAVNTVIRHTSGLRLKMDELLYQMSAMQKGWETLSDHIDRLAAVNTGLDTFLRNVVGDRPDKEGSAQTRWDNRIADIFKRVAQEHSTMGLPIPSEENKFQVSLWEAFNGVQGYVQHSKSRRGEVDTVGKIILADNDPLVVAAESYAEELLGVAA